MVVRESQNNANPVGTPTDSNVRLVADDGYSNEVGSLIYAAVGTRPDIAQAVSAISRFNSAPKEAHLTAAKRVLRYLKGTLELSLIYSRIDNDNSNTVGYSDAEWAGDCDGRRSTTGSCFLAAGAAITWLSQCQPSVALSTTETEYVALCATTQTAVWLRRLESNIGKKAVDGTLIYEDNQGAIAMAKNPVAHRRTKHLDIKFHFVREKVGDGTHHRAAVLQHERDGGRHLDEGHPATTVCLSAGQTGAPLVRVYVLFKYRSTVVATTLCKV